MIWNDEFCVAIFRCRCLLSQLSTCSFQVAHTHIRRLTKFFQPQKCKEWYTIGICAEIRVRSVCRNRRKWCCNRKRRISMQRQLFTLLFFTIFFFHFIFSNGNINICRFVVWWFCTTNIYTHIIFIARQTRQKDRRNDTEYGAYSPPEQLARVSFAFGRGDEKSSARHCRLSNVFFNLWWRWRVNRLTRQVENMIESTESTDRINRIYARRSLVCAMTLFFMPTKYNEKKYEIQSTQKSNSIQCTLHSRMQFILLLILRLRNTLWPMCVSVYVWWSLIVWINYCEYTTTTTSSSLRSARFFNAKFQKWQPFNETHFQFCTIFFLRFVCILVYGFGCLRRRFDVNMIRCLFMVTF